MRVLCVNHLLYYINDGLFEAMRDKGYELKILPLGKYPKSDQKRILKSMLQEFKPDYVFTPGWSQGIFETDMFIKMIKKYKIPHVYWAAEDPIFFDEVSMIFAPHCDYVFTTSIEFKKKYNALGKDTSTLLFGCNPKIFRKTPVKLEYQHDIVLVANNYDWFSEDNSFRRKAIRNIVAPLVRGGYDIKIFGSESWMKAADGFSIDSKYYGGSVNYHETPYIYSSAKIVLGIQSVNTSSTQTSVRTYEILGTGAFHITCYTPSHENIFNNHEHLVWSNSQKETIDLVDYYLKHDKEREQIAEQGQEEVLSKHTYAHRLFQLETEFNPMLYV
ncbi:CgeB family protein [Anaerosolibacter sp.]|uniref:CgeB family protein n=1 Tax=Anaerosolibacter sp. TaxID=1872527 RepID=UPI00260F0CEC|nr:glycosyltransferase [Anaerosolibacter sp.]